MPKTFFKRYAKVCRGHPPPLQSDWLPRISPHPSGHLTNCTVNNGTSNDNNDADCEDDRIDTVVNDNRVDGNNNSLHSESTYFRQCNRITVAIIIKKNIHT